MVYDVTEYLEQHPGGSEVMMEVMGKYADDMFEDIGHSTEARHVMKKYLKGPLKVRRNAGAPARLQAYARRVAPPLLALWRDIRPYRWRAAVFVNNDSSPGAEESRPDRRCARRSGWR